MPSSLDIPEFKLQWEQKDENGEEIVYDDYRNANSKYLKFTNFQKETGQDVVLYQDFTLGKGGIFWDGSYTLLQYFLRNYHDKLTAKAPNDMSILELGAGTALPGIVTGLLGYNVIITDLGKLMPFVEKNVALNIKPECKNVACHELEWGNKSHFEKIGQKFDIIFGAELIYLEETFEDLVKTFLEFSADNTIILMTYKIRLQWKVDQFFQKFDEYFDKTLVQTDILTQYHPNPSQYLVVAQLKKGTTKTQ